MTPELTLRASYRHLAGVSNTTRYDAFLLRHLAAELDAAVRGRRVRDIAFDRATDRLLVTFDDRILEWSISPDRSGPVWLDQAETVGRSLILPRKAHVRQVEAPPDERIVVLSLGGAARLNATTQIVIELVGTNWNVVALDSEGRIRKTLRRSETLRTGTLFSFPPRTGRAGVDAPIDLESWESLLQPIAPADRVSALQRHIAYSSAINARALLGTAAEDDAASALHEAYERYIELLSSGSTPVLLQNGLNQPYPHPLWGVQNQRFESLVAAFAAARSGAVADYTVIGRAIAREQRKIERLRQESTEGAVDAQRLRGLGDLLLANLYQVGRGMQRVELTDFEGNAVTVDLDPTRSPSENAQHYYEQARKRERAAERVPALIEAAEAEVRRLEGVLRRIESGEAVEVGMAQTRLRKVGAPTGRSLPYRRYQTSGGFEVRVGRTGRANDELTFRHAAPEEIWLHARDVGGAHVVLRWKGDGNPPRQDLTEAAILAALHSKARSSGTVPVDWTRRKYVRKPRRSPPGRVAVERASTIFVEPDPALKETLRWPGDAAEE